MNYKIELENTENIISSLYRQPACLYLMFHQEYL